MPTERPKAGLVETTITTGTGSYALLGPLSPWRGLVAADDGKIFTYGVYQDGVGFEEGEGTYNHGARTLSRTVTANHLGTTAPIDWGAGSKEVSNVIAAARVVMTSVQNQYLADQFFRAFKLVLDADDDSWISAVSDDIIRFFLNSGKSYRFERAKLTMTLADDTATEGPELAIDRNSATPAVNDPIGVFRFTGRDSAGATVTALKIRPSLTAVAPGAHSSKIIWDIAKTGALQPVLALQPDTLSVQSGVSLYSAAKVTSNLNVVGAELTDTGEVIGVVQDGPAGIFMRKGSGTAVLQVGQDGVVQGEATIAGATVTWGGFTGHHWVEWEPSFNGGAFEALGTVVQTADGMLSSTPDPIKYVIPASNGSRRVYGVIGERQGGRIVDNIEMSLLLIFAVGNGWIRTIGTIADGDLLWASSNLGLAEAQPDQDVVGPWTVAKALGPSAGTGEDLVPCTYMAGG